MTIPHLRTGPLDHLLLVQRHPIEVARFAAAIGRGLDQDGGAVLELQVVHEDDGSCCRREPWAATLLFLIADPEPAASIDDGMPEQPGRHRPRSRR